MRAKMMMAAVLMLSLSACAASGGTPETVNAPDGKAGGKARGLKPTETNDGGIRQAPPPPEDGESAIPDGVS
jgi:hypothetical protein